jgi:hypothetical protein
MQTTFDGPFGSTDGPSHSETFVVMRTGDGGLELLGEDRTLALSPDDVRILLFYGSTVELEGSEPPGGATAAIGVDPRRYAVVLAFGGRAYHAPRWAITAVARGRLPVAYLQADRRSLPSAWALRPTAARS